MSNEEEHADILKLIGRLSNEKGLQFLACVLLAFQRLFENARKVVVSVCGE